MRISDWSSDVCSSDLSIPGEHGQRARPAVGVRPFDQLSAADQFRAHEVARLDQRVHRLIGHLPATVRNGQTAARDRVVERLQLCGCKCHVSRRTILSDRSEEHTSELQSLMRISYAVFCLKKKNTTTKTICH